MYFVFYFLVALAKVTLVILKKKYRNCVKYKIKSKITTKTKTIFCMKFNITRRCLLMLR